MRIAQRQRGVKLFVGGVGSGKTCQIHTNILQQTRRPLVVASGRFYFQSTAVQHDELVLVAQFVALGMAAKVIVVVENQDLGISADVLEIVIGARQSAQAPAHHHQIVDLAGLLGPGYIDMLLIAQGMGAFERSRMRAPHSETRGRIRVHRRRRECLLRGQGGGGESESPQGHGNPVDKVASRDVAMHAQIAVVQVARSVSIQLWITPCCRRGRRV